MEDLSFIDAISNLEVVAVDSYQLMRQVILDIHHQRDSIDEWLSLVCYDFEFQSYRDGKPDLFFKDWGSYMKHYYQKVRKVLQCRIKPIINPPKDLVIATLNSEEMVILYDL